MRKLDKGFTLVEVLVAFSIIILFSSLVLPAFTLMIAERKNNMMQHEANVLLQEKVHTYHVTGTIVEEKEMISGVEYVMYGDGGNVYIEWTDLLGRKKKKERIIISTN
jgi:competence protein ComGE